VVKFFFSENTGSWISKAIKYFGGSTHSHTGMLLDDTLTFEATDFGCTIRRWKYRYLDKPKMSYEVYQFNPRFQKALDEAVQQIVDEVVDTPYGWAQLFGFMWVWVVKKVTGKSIKNPVRDGEGNIICTELHYYVLRRAAKLNPHFATWVSKNFPDIDPDTIVPDKLWEAYAKEDGARLVAVRGYSDGTTSTWET
jgi:hypothetical protein